MSELTLHTGHVLLYDINHVLIQLWWNKWWHLLINATSSSNSKSHLHIEQEYWSLIFNLNSFIVIKINGVITLSNLSSGTNILTFKDRVRFHKMAEDVAKAYLKEIRIK